MFKNINILKCHEHNMRNPNLECIQIRTNIFGIGSLIREIDVNISEMLENKILLLSKTNARFLSVNA